MTARTTTVLLDGLAFPEGPALARRSALVLQRPARPPRRRDGRRRQGRDDRRGAAATVGPRLAPRRPHARRVDARPARAAARGRRRSSSTPTSPRSRPARATTWSSTRTAARTSATSASTCTAARSRATTCVIAGRARRRRARRGRRPRVPERHGDHARRLDADRRRELRRPAHARSTIAADGSLVDRRLFGAARTAPSPDGICLDAEGAVWVACPFTGRVPARARGGEIARRGEGHATTSRSRACSAATTAARCTCAPRRAAIPRRRSRCAGRIERRSKSRAPSPDPRNPLERSPRRHGARP